MNGEEEGCRKEEEGVKKNVNIGGLINPVTYGLIDVFVAQSPL